MPKQFKKELSERKYSLAFKRWLVRELNESNLTRNEAVHYFQVTKPSLSLWACLYSDAHELPLVDMTAAEKAEIINCYCIVPKFNLWRATCESCAA